VSFAVDERSRTTRNRTTTTWSRFRRAPRRPRWKRCGPRRVRRERRTLPDTRETPV